MHFTPGGVGGEPAGAHTNHGNRSATPGSAIALEFLVMSLFCYKGRKLPAN